MAKTNFYELWHIENIPEKYRASWSDKDIESKSIVCPVNDGHQRSSGRLNNLTVIIEDGDAFKYDFIWTWYSEPMINERVAKILKDEDLTGYELKPVTIKKVKKNNPKKIPQYQELNVTGKAGVHPDTGLIVVERCDACKHVDYRGWKNKLIIDEKKWDGSDFFHLDPYPGGIFVSERVKEVFEKHKVTGVKFTPSEECKDTWRIDETEREKWRKIWDEVYSNLYPDIYPKLSDEDKGQFRWEIINAATETSKKWKKEKKRIVDEKANEEMEKVAEKWKKEKNII